jgi:hypothetical protein
LSQCCCVDLRQIERLNGCYRANISGVPLSLHGRLPPIGPGPRTGAFDPKRALDPRQVLSRFLEQPDVPAHRNRGRERHQAFLPLGTEPGLFMDTQLGARASANLYSIVSTCRANGVEPLTHLYEMLPLATTAADLEALLPWNVKPLLKATTASKA